MDARLDARREVVLAAVLLVAVAGIVPGLLGLWVAGLTGIAVAAGSVAVFGRADPRSIPPEAVIVPAVLAAGAAGAIRLVPTGIAWAAALALFGIALRATLRLESRLVGATSSPSDGDRLRVIVSVLGTAFVAFAGVAALVPGALGAIGPDAPATALTEESLVALVVADGLVAFLLGFRAAAVRYPATRDRLWAAATYAIVVALTAGVARAIDLPRLVGPAVLTLVLYLWDTVQSAAPARRREIRFVWETALLVVLGVVVVAWNLRLRT